MTKADLDLETLRHSTAHVLAHAVRELFPGVKLGIGPAIESGFYYDFDLPTQITPEDLHEIEDDKVSVYKSGDFIALCRGPHIEHPGHIKAFKLLSIAGAYWHGIETNPMMQRIYGAAFPSQKELYER